MGQIQIRRWVIVVLVVTLVISASLAIIFGIRWQAARDEVNREATQHAVVQATNAYRVDTVQNLALAAQVQALLEEGDTDMALALALEAVKGDAPSWQAQSVLAAAAYAPGIRRKIELPELSSSGSMVVTPDGQTLIYGGSELIFIDVNSGQEVKRLGGVGGLALNLVLSPDGRRLLSVTGRVCKVWDVASGEVIAVLEDFDATSLSQGLFSPDGRLLLLSIPREPPVVWDVDANTMLRRLDDFTTSPRGMAFRPDGQAVLLSFWEGDLVLVDVQSGEIINRYEGADTAAAAIVFDTIGGVFFTGSIDPDSPVLMWETETGEIRERLSGAWGPVSQLALSPNERFLLGSASNGRELVMWDVRTGQLAYRYRDIWAPTITFTPDSQQVVVGPTGQAAYVLDIVSGAEQHRFPGQFFGIQDLAFSPDCTRILTAAQGEGLWLWDTATGQRLRQFVHDGASIKAIAFAPDGQTAYALTEDCTISRWNVTTGEAVGQWPIEHSRSCSALAVRSDGERLAVGNRDGQLMIWDVVAGEVAHQWEGHEYEIVSVDFSPDGHTLLSGAKDSSVNLFVSDTGELLRHVMIEESYKPPVTSVRFSPDGQQYLVVYHDQTLVLYAVSSGDVLLRREGILGADFDPNGTTLALATSDGTLVLWDLDVQREWRRWQAAPEHLDRPFLQLRFSPDGHWLATRDVYHEATLWRVDTLEELVTWAVYNRAIPELTCAEQERYRLDPICDESGLIPTYTPAPTRSPTPTLDLTQTTATVPATSISEPPVLSLPTLTPSRTPPRPPAQVPTFQMPTFLPTLTMPVFGAVTGSPTHAPPTISAPTFTASPAPPTRVAATIPMTVEAGDSAGLATALAAPGPAVIELGPGNYEIDESLEIGGSGEHVIQTGDIAGLIAALTAANENPEMDVIRLEPGVYMFSEVYAADTALPAITTAITIEGQGAIFERVEDSDAFRFFLVSESGHLVLRNLTLQGGGGEGLDGGSMLNQGRLELEGVTVRRSYARRGGALSNAGGEVMVQDCVFTDNTAVETGSAIDNAAGEMDIVRSSFKNNAGQDAGGIHNAGSLTIRDSNLSGSTLEN